MTVKGLRGEEGIENRREAYTVFSVFSYYTKKSIFILTI